MENGKEAGPLPVKEGLREPRKENTVSKGLIQLPVLTILKICIQSVHARKLVRTTKRFVFMAKTLALLVPGGCMALCRSSFALFVEVDHDVVLFNHKRYDLYVQELHTGPFIKLMGSSRSNLLIMATFANAHPVSNPVKFLHCTSRRSNQCLAIPTSWPQDECEQSRTCGAENGWTIIWTENVLEDMTKLSSHVWQRRVLRLASLRNATLDISQATTVRRCSNISREKDKKIEIHMLLAYFIPNP